jgi:hypothetical protein
MQMKSYYYAYLLTLFISLVIFASVVAMMLNLKSYLTLRPGLELNTNMILPFGWGC